MAYILRSQQACLSRLPIRWVLRGLRLGENNVPYRLNHHSLLALFKWVCSSGSPLVLSKESWFVGQTPPCWVSRCSTWRQGVAAGVTVRGIGTVQMSAGLLCLGAMCSKQIKLGLKAWFVGSAGRLRRN